ncbi:ATP-binding protein [Pedobacter sp. L105]|uniref:ATP-binding protein n=1 Tax=Pedobacter sp. L105 TaxID=1641871 RepID=UPI001C206A7A|nr:ATP-binding protein [Pedobacter sp. L105]
MLKKIGRTWDDIGISNAKLEDLDSNSISSFVKKAVKSGRIYKEAEKDDIPTLLENLQLITPDGELKAAGILLFGKNPKKFFVTSYFKIGKFGDSDSELKFQDTVEGNIFDMVEAVITLLKQRYIISKIGYEGIQRIEKPEYPDAAIREAILNAIVHKDYTDSTIQMSIYDDKIILWNPGKLSEDLTIEKLKSKHPSRARNKNIAEVFFKAGYIESWGRGIEKMIDAFKGDGLPEPIFEENSGGFQVTFLKDSYSQDFLNQIGLNERQIKAVTYLKDVREFTNAKYQEINNIGKSISAIELQELIDKGIINKIGKGKLTKYSLK